MIDLHCHLLPGVDDGPDDLGEAVGMCLAAAEDGCTDLVATPHQRHDFWWNGDRSELERLRAELQEAVDAETAHGPRIHLGAEVRVGEGLLDALEGGPDDPPGDALALAGTRYLLIELSRFVPDPDPLGLIHELTLLGWRPVLAHPEHIRWLADDLRLLEELVERGAALQITGMSLLGGFGRSIRKRTRTLLDAGLAHLLASDAHDLETRPTGLSRAAAEVARRWGDEVAELLTETNPRALLEDRPLRTVDAGPTPAKAGANGS